MKTLLTALVAMIIGGTVRAESIDAGPTGGRLLANAPPRAEFVVNAERKVEIRMFDAELHPVAVGEQVVTVIAEAPSGKTTLTLTNSAGMLVSTDPLPEGDGYNVVVQVRAAAEAKPQNFRVALHTGVCGGCQRAEYACTCEEHGGGDAHGH
ncbi:MAG: hypothetical protein O3B24_06070 [Verrucomicrobia bacterium]|nr:hypothetical protein [Verrucomicrobiota bacterium]